MYRNTQRIRSNMSSVLYLATTALVVFVVTISLTMTTMSTLVDATTTSVAFVSSIPTATRTAARPIMTPSKTQLEADFFKNILKGNLQQDDNNNNDANDSLPTTIFRIPAKQVKVGALKFLLQIALVGLSNKPSQGTWFLKQNEADGIDMYFKDGTAMVSLVFTEYSVWAERYGSQPSLQYQLQESVMLHGVLDELEKTAFGTGDEGETIQDENRLLWLSDDTLIPSIREGLPARTEAE